MLGYLLSEEQIDSGQVLLIEIIFNGIGTSHVSNISSNSMFQMSTGCFDALLQAFTK